MGVANFATLLAPYFPSLHVFVHPSFCTKEGHRCSQEANTLQPRSVRNYVVQTASPLTFSFFNPTNRKATIAHFSWNRLQKVITIINMPLLVIWAPFAMATDSLEPAGGGSSADPNAATREGEGAQRRRNVRRRCVTGRQGGRRLREIYRGREGRETPTTAGTKSSPSCLIRWD